VKLTDEDIREFTELWSREFGETLTPDQARHEASLLLELYWLLVQPLPRAEAPNEPGTSSKDAGTDSE
jgi:hypothetical protein